MNGPQQVFGEFQCRFNRLDNIRISYRFSDSGLTPEIIQMLADICEEKNIQRLMLVSFV